MQRKQYKDAVFGVWIAKDKQKETHTTAHIVEKNKRRQAFTANTKLARSYFSTATDKFIELDLIANAV